LIYFYIENFFIIEICAKEAVDMNINFDNYKISTTDIDKDSFNYQCTICDKKFRNKMQLIDVRSCLY
jgi:rRNA maturation endonuclease Nob1